MVLGEYVPYTVGIYAVNSAGNGETVNKIFFSKQSGMCNVLMSNVIFHHICTVPSSAPSDVVVTRVNTTSINVTWTPLTLTEARGVITGYVLNYVVATSTRSKRALLEVSHDMSSYVITRLLTDKAYGVSVACKTEVGTGPFSNVMYEGS